MMRYDDRDLEEVKAAIDWEKKLCSEINEISKEVPRWSYDLVDELEVLMDASPKESHIRSPKDERIVLFNNKTDSNDNQNSAKPDINIEFAVVHYSHEPDYCRDLIRGSMRPQRRKTVTYKLFQGTAHSPLFWEIMGDYAFLFGDLVYDISQYLKEYFRKSGTDNSEFLAFEKTIEQKELEENKDESEIRLRQIEEAWESILYGHSSISHRIANKLVLGGYSDKDLIPFCSETVAQ
ncbi:hypothetical protein RYX36_018278 [Vicia faba]